MHEHKDILGNPITETSKLAVSKGNELYICSVIKSTPKMLRVRRLIYKSDSDGILVYPDQTVVVDGPDVLAYMLKAR